MKTVPIERKANVSRATFTKEHVSGQGMPVVLTDATEHWPALSKWTFEFFKASYGSQFATAPTSLKGKASRLTTLSTYIDFLDRPADLPGVWLDRGDRRPIRENLQENTAAPYLMGWKPFSKHPELYDDIAPAPAAIEDWVLALDPALRDVFQWAATRDYWSIFIGPQGSLSELHQDYWSTHAYLAQIRGRKKALLFSPADTPLLYDGEVNPENPDLDRHPLIEGATAYECEIGPGDLLFIPSNWWHWVKGLEKSITVSHNFFNEVNISAHLVSIIRKTPRLIEALDMFPDWAEALRPKWTSKGFVEEGETS